MTIHQRGLALAEVLVAMMLSLLVAVVAATLLHASTGDFMFNGANTRIDDNGRFVLAVIGQALRQAGYPGEPDATPPSAPAALAVEGRDAASVASQSDGMGAPLPAINGSDVLAIRYAPAANPGAGGGSAMLNCAGFPSEAGEWAWSIFYVARASDGVAELRCKYKGEHGWGADAVIRGVDAFHVLYAIDTDTPRDGIPNRHLTASAINAIGPDGWQRVTSVRIALLLHGERGSRPGSQLSRYELLPGADPEARIDEAGLPPAMRHRTRRLFTASVALRNQ
ncbi:PilW family protein [Pseudoduganella sp. OTU4001]|uniref:PilW family protein n=1 Tax=Pseudoduganella sp. OTU4001 TaxID=3043854 RepID=UPI00313C459D